MFNQTHLQLKSTAQLAITTNWEYIFSVMLIKLLQLAARPAEPELVFIMQSVVDRRPRQIVLVVSKKSGKSTTWVCPGDSLLSAICQNTQCSQLLPGKLLHIPHIYGNYSDLQCDHNCAINIIAVLKPCVKLNLCGGGPSDLSKKRNRKSKFKQVLFLYSDIYQNYLILKNINWNVIIKENEKCILIFEVTRYCPLHTYKLCLILMPTCFKESQVSHNSVQCGNGLFICNIKF